MSVSAGFVDMLKEQLAEFGSVSVRRMFGGAGIYNDGVMFGLIADDTLYLKADDINRSAFEAEDMKPFAYQGKGGHVAIMSYWQVPERLLDDPDELAAWARGALAAAHRAASDRVKRSGKRR